MIKVVNQPPSFTQLSPFAKSVAPFGIFAQAKRSGRRLEVCFQLRGDFSGVRIPELSTEPKRCDRLWEHTCFEIFLNPVGSSAYWECNFSPAGDWAAYCFTDYRSQMQVEEQILGIEILATGSTQAQREWKFSIDLASVAELINAPKLQCGLTAVVEHDSQGLTHWAIAHSGAKPDFHLRESFVYSVE